jgi:hypothetical protein
LWRFGEKFTDKSIEALDCFGLLLNVSNLPDMVGRHGRLERRLLIIKRTLIGLFGLSLHARK